VSLDDGGGAFNGMSHSGARLIVRNTGDETCLLRMRVGIRFKDAKGNMLVIGTNDARLSQRGMMSGALSPSLRLPAGKNASATLRWVSGNVYDHGRCLRPTSIGLQFGLGDVANVRFDGVICGEQGKVVMVDQSSFALASQ
jgi:hypothetical protein